MIICFVVTLYIYVRHSVLFGLYDLATRAGILVSEMDDQVVATEQANTQVSHPLANFCVA